MYKTLASLLGVGAAFEDVGFLEDEGKHFGVYVARFCICVVVVGEIITTLK